MLLGCSEASKLRAHPLKDIPLLDRLYARVTVSVKEGWQPHAGPSKLRDAPNPFTQKSNQLNRLENWDHVGKGKAVASRKQVNPDKWERLTTAIENQGKFWKGGR
ncbi:hypothetical protein HID58_054733 [Brassica napus]|uniref:Uncharacterized protein n=1 Tax=Brassica napus TaxID=3708 RepID=A0ABQ8AIC1_BRANA|nr:hypothetical protein HID58_054733 [Brassica napus]